MTGNEFNVLVSDYLCNYFMALPLLPMVGRDNKVTAKTLKYFPTSEHPKSVRGNCIRSAKGPMRVKSKSLAQPFKVQ